MSRSRNSRSGVKVFLWDIRKGFLEEGALDGVEYIIHLAGEGIADQKWTEERKRSILKSRTEGPAFLLSEIKRKGVQLKGFFSASGINYFGSSTDDRIYTEQDPPGDDWISSVVVEWEKAVDAFLPHCRTVKFRFGLVLDKNEGGLPKMAFPVQFGFGAALGTGKQWVPWIHVEDACRAFLFAIENESLTGSFNCISPQHVTNKELTRNLAKVLRMPLWLPNVPAFALRIFLGELSVLVLEGSRASSEHLTSRGFTFRYPDLTIALKEIYGVR